MLNDDGLEDERHQSPREPQSQDPVAFRNISSSALQLSGDTRSFSAVHFDDWAAARERVLPTAFRAVPAMSGVVLAEIHTKQATASTYDRQARFLCFVFLFLPHLFFFFSNPLFSQNSFQQAFDPGKPTQTVAGKRTLGDVEQVKGASPPPRRRRYLAP